MKTKEFKKRANALIGVIVVLVSAMYLLIAGQAVAQTNTEKSLKFKGGSCNISELILRPMFAPADMKDTDKAFMLRLKYKLNSDATSDDLSAIYNEGKFIAVNGEVYKAGVSILNDSIYSLIVAVPKEVDVEAMKFEYNKQSLPLKQE